jgi:type I restriction enzyme M protein
MMLPKEARYEELLSLPKDPELGAALVGPIDASEGDVDWLVGQLPKDYTNFENSLLEDLLCIFDSDVLHKANGDVFGRINEYFLIRTIRTSRGVATRERTKRIELQQPLRSESNR